MAQAPRTLTVALIYAAGVAQGLALVTFPAANAILTSSSGFALSSVQYGLMFVPQVVLAIAASALAPRASRAIGLHGVLLIGLAADVVAMALLAASPLLIGSSAAFAVLCLATAALGLGFGATVMALNTLVEGLFPEKADGAVLALNALLGLGTALAPLLVAAFTGLGIWWALPLLAAVFLAALLGAFAILPRQAQGEAPSVGASEPLPARFWLYAGAAFLYGVVETLCGNWAIPYLSGQTGVTAAQASFALTAFWIMVTAGRVLFAFTARWVSEKLVYVALPIALALVFQFVAHIGGATGGIVGFGAAGLACSAFLPLSISFGGAEFPEAGDDDFGRADRHLSSRLRRRGVRRRAAARLWQPLLCHGVFAGEHRRRRACRAGLERDAHKYRSPVGNSRTRTFLFTFFRNYAIGCLVGVQSPRDGQNKGQKKEKREFTNNSLKTLSSRR